MCSRVLKTQNFRASRDFTAILTILFLAENPLIFEKLKTSVSTEFFDFPLRNTPLVAGYWLEITKSSTQKKSGSSEMRSIVKN